MHRALDILDTQRTRITVMDGAMSTALTEYTETQRLPVCDLLCLRQPEAVAHIHRAYIDAGAEIICTNTFNANALVLGQYLPAQEAADCAADINRRATDIARQCADTVTDTPRPLVAGVIAPTQIALTYTPQSLNDYTTAIAAQITALADSGVDILLFESLYDGVNARAAGDTATQMHTGIPLIFSATLTLQGILPSGHTLAEFVEAVTPAHPTAIGLNCCNGLQNFVEHLRRLRQCTTLPVVAYPSAGIPDATGTYPDSPEDFEHTAHQIISERLADIFGGCCGTTPQHIAAIRRAADSVTI